MKLLNLLKPPVLISKSLKIGYVEDGSPAFNSGLLRGDKIISIDGLKVKNWNDIVSIIKKNPDININLNILRENNYINIEVLPELVRSDNLEYGRLGISPLVEEKEIQENKRIWLVKLKKR